MTSKSLPTERSVSSSAAASGLVSAPFLVDFVFFLSIFFSWGWGQYIVVVFFKDCWVGMFYRFPGFAQVLLVLFWALS